MSDAGSHISATRIAPNNHPAPTTNEPCTQMKSHLRKLFSTLPASLRGSLTFVLSGHNNLSNVLRDLESKGLPFGTIYDIGARHAEWAKSIKKTFPKSEVVLFEANEKCRDILAQSKFRFFLGILSSEIKDVKFYENDSTGDSYYKENTAHYDSITPIERRTTTLDLVALENKLPPPDFIKLDTQGSELDILSGGSNCLQNASLVYIECPIIPYNIGAPGIQNYISVVSH